jgi:hypothetical protein
MILVDAHVHIYDCFDLRIFLDSAFANFRAEATRLGHEDISTNVLFLTETARENWFQRLKEYTCQGFDAGGKTTSQWSFHPTSEDCSLCAKEAGDKTLFFIAGRQIVTAEDLEVLALATDKVFEDGAPLEEVIRTIRNSDAIPVVPWGPGKWMGKRGEILGQILNGPEVPGLFLGDNGNRPSFWPNPSHLRLAEKKGIRILPGSDPLPFTSESCRPGSFGFLVNDSISPDYPAKDLKRILAKQTTCLQPYGHLENPWRFFRNQISMQILKRMRRGTSSK